LHEACANDPHLFTGQGKDEYLRFQGRVHTQYLVAQWPDCNEFIGFVNFWETN